MRKPAPDAIIVGAKLNVFASLYLKIALMQWTGCKHTKTKKR